MEQKLAELTRYITDNMATKSDLLNTRDEIMLAMATKADKSDISDLKETIVSLDKRTDEDIRAVIKDVAQLKNR